MLSRPMVQGQLCPSRGTPLVAGAIINDMTISNRSDVHLLRSPQCHDSGHDYDHSNSRVQESHNHHYFRRAMPSLASSRLLLLRLLVVVLALSAPVLAKNNDRDIEFDDELKVPWPLRSSVNDWFRHVEVVPQLKCSSSDKAKSQKCAVDNVSGEGQWYCRTLFHPLTGHKHETNVCATGEVLSKGASCGCCNGVCPPKCLCPCQLKNNNGQEGRSIILTRRNGTLRRSCVDTDFANTIVHVRDNLACDTECKEAA